MRSQRAGKDQDYPGDQKSPLSSQCVSFFRTEV
jgi:hypothetical protein